MGPQNDDLSHNPAADPFSNAPAEDTDQTPAIAAPMSFGLLFQAPDTQVRAPRPQEQDPQDAPFQTGEAGDAPPQNGAAQDAAADDQGTGRSRRRGGRGRRAKAEDKTGNTTSSNAGNNNTAGNNTTGNNEAGTDKASTDNADSDKAGRGQDDANADESADSSDGRQQSAADGDGASRRRTRRRRRSAGSPDSDDPPGTVTKVREPRRDRDEVTSIKGSTRLEAKKQRRREGREAGRRRTIITEAEFLARRESVDRIMVVREKDGRTQIGVLEDGVLVEHYVSRDTQQASMAGNVYLGRVQNVLPSMEAAFVDIGRGRNAVLYAGEVNWDAAGLDNQPRRIEHALKAGESVLVQVTKDPIGHKGARLTSQISLPGRFLVYVPGNAMTGISRKLPDTERARLKKILKEIVPADAGVIVRTAAEGASEEDLRADVERLQKIWERIEAKTKTANAPALLHGEPDLTVRVIRDVFNEDFGKLIVSGDQAYTQVSDYLGSVAPDLAERLEKWTGSKDVFTVYRIDEQLAKALDRKVWLPSGGSLIIDRTEAMTVIDVNTGKFVGSGGNLEETVTKNNLEAAEEIVRQLRLRDIGGIIVVDFIDMVLESNRDLVVRRLLECLGRDRTKHQVAEVTSLGLVQMTRKRVGSGLVEIFSEPCTACGGRGIIVHDHPVDKATAGNSGGGNTGNRSSRGKSRGKQADDSAQDGAANGAANGSANGGSNGAANGTAAGSGNGPSAAQIAAAAHAAAMSAGDKTAAQDDLPEAGQDNVGQDTVGQDNARHDSAGHDSADQSVAGASTVVNTAPSTVATTAAQQPGSSAPAVQPRRKRKRVVAPAGPPTAIVADGTTGDLAAAESSE